MDLDFTKTREFSVGRELARLIATSGILHKAWEGICSVNKGKGNSFLLIEDEGVVIVAFPSFHNEDCTVPDSKYGECNIQNEKIFSASLRDDDAKPVCVHKGALNRFLHVLGNSDFKAKDNHAFSALQNAGEVKNEQEMNTEKLNLELSEKQSYMAELEWYKTRCKDNKIGYYDTFKQHDAKRDFHVNLARRNLGNFWDNIVDQEEKHVLPSDFRTRNKWINAATAYRRLVEPLDIAYHYRTDKENKSYLSDRVRPHRHIVLEKWMKDKERTRTGREGIGRTSFASLTEDTVFWARLEDACKAPISPLQEELENDIGRMIANKSISVEVFLEQSSFMKWWEQYSHIQLPSPQWRSSSPLFTFMEKECRKQNA